jgi:hypothetical protein
VFGKSSGGYGAITHALRHSDIWSAAACHSGDMGFELCYLPDMPAVLRALAGAENSIEPWWQPAGSSQKAPGRFLQGDQRAGDGGQLRSECLSEVGPTGTVIRGHNCTLADARFSDINRTWKRPKLG